MGIKTDDKVTIKGKDGVYKVSGIRGHLAFLTNDNITMSSTPESGIYEKVTNLKKVDEQ